MYTSDDWVKMGHFTPPPVVAPEQGPLRGPSVLQSEHNLQAKLVLEKQQRHIQLLTLNAGHLSPASTAWSGWKVWSSREFGLAFQFSIHVAFVSCPPFLFCFHFYSFFHFYDQIFALLFHSCVQAQSLSTWCPPLVTTLSCWQRSKQGRASSPRLTVKATPPSFPAVDLQAIT